jgi:ligand-binding SRPBCC domain-containing protein
MSDQRSTQVFVRRTRLAVSADEAFRWHERPGAIQRLTPPWERHS